MIEITNVANQSILANASALFDTTALQTCCGAERHRTGGSQVTLSKSGIYEVSFSGDIAIPSTGTVGVISMSLAVDGEALVGTKMTSTPTVLNSFSNVATTALVKVCSPCCATVSVLNTSTQAISLQNANLVVKRVS